MILLVPVIIGLGLIAAGITFWSSTVGCDNRKRVAFMHSTIALLVVSGGLAVISVLVWWGSYDNYLDDRAFYDGVIEQYRGAVEMYSGYALLDEAATIHTLTDFRYKGYQEEIAGMIRDLRRNVSNYNESVIKKRVIVKHPFFGPIIVPPDDDMLIIRMVEEKKGAGEGVDKILKGLDELDKALEGSVKGVDKTLEELDEVLEGSV